MKAYASCTATDLIYAEGVTPFLSLNASINFDLEAKPALVAMASIVRFLDSPASINLHT
jgi:hypothetical protein